MADPTRHGLLNGHPSGPELPPSVPCEVCGTPVWCTEQATAYRGDEPVQVRGVFEADWLAVAAHPDWPWALTEHRCRPTRPWDPVDCLRTTRVLPNAYQWQDGGERP